MAVIERKKVKDLMFFGNGNIAAFDESGEQLPDIQKWSWVDMIVRKFEGYGYDLSDVSIYTPDGSRWKLEPVYYKNHRKYNLVPEGDG